MIPVALFIGCLLISLFVSRRLYRRFGNHDIPDRWMACLVPPAIVTLSGLFFHKIYGSIFYDWNWIHLQPSFVFIKGLGVYHGPDSGPVLNAIYGPVSVLAFAPAVLAASPESAMVIAEVLAMAFFFLPVLWLHAASAGRRERMFFAFFVFLVFCFVPFVSSPLRSSAFHVHADAPALGLGALACAALYFRKRAEDGVYLGLSALFAVLAVWTKQVTLPLLVALPLFVLLADGWRVFLRYVGFCLAAGVGVSLAFVAIFGGPELFFNLVTIPASHPWRAEGFPPAALKLARECLIVAALVLPAFGLFLFRKGESGTPGGAHGKISHALRSHPWLLFLIVSCFMIPVSLMGKTKVGGSNNTLSFTLYYLVIAGTLALASPPTEAIFKKAKKFAVLVMVVFLVIHVPGVLYRCAFPKHPTNYARVAYDFAKRHPGEGYFPRLTVLSLMAEGTLYHDSTGLRDRQWSGFKIAKDHFDRHIPARMRLIAFREGGDDEMDCMQVPSYSTPAIRDPELPGFLVYVESGGMGTVPKGDSPNLGLSPKTHGGSEEAKSPEHRR